MPRLEFQLPAAPSLNNALANVPGRGRVKTARYLKWLRNADAHYLLQALQRAERITVPFVCTMVFPCNLRGDIDGKAKLILDYMVSRGLTIDDRHCRKLTLEYGKAGDMVVIEVEPYEAEQDGEPRPGPA